MEPTPILKSIATNAFWRRVAALASADRPWDDAWLDAARAYPHPTICDRIRRRPSQLLGGGAPGGQLGAERRQGLAGPPKVGPPLCRIFAVISPDSPRYAGLVAESGCDHAWLLSAEAVPLGFPDGGPDEPHYLVDFRALREDVRRRINSNTAALCGVELAEALEEFGELGVPIRAADVAILSR